MTFEKSLKEKQRALDTIHAATGWYALLVQDNPTSVNISTVATGTDIITAPGHDFVNGTRVTLANVGGSLPGALAASTEYRVIAAVPGSTLQLCVESTYDPATKTGTAIDITSTGSGTSTITERPLSNKDDLDVWVRKEANYFGSARQPLTMPAAIINYTNQQASIGSVNCTFAPTSGSITYRYFAVISGGIATTGSSQGTLAGFEDYVFTQTIDSAGKIFQYGVVI